MFKEAVKRGLLKRKKVLRSLRDGQPQIWCEPLKTTPKQRAAAREAVRRGEREINALLSKESHPPPRGRKADPDYDMAIYRLKLAELRGKRIPMAKLAADILKTDKSSDQDKQDKLTQAIKRRRNKR